MSVLTRQETPARERRGWIAPFFTIWIGQAFSLFGSMLVQFALVWWLTQTTGSATVLAAATLAAVLPGVVLGPFVGALVDRWDRRVVMVVADTAIALAIVGLALISYLGAMRVWHVYGIMLIRALAGSFHWPAMQASTSLMVPERHLSRVAGANQALNGALNIIAPPAGALLLGILPLYGVMAIDVATAMLAVLPLFFIAIPQPQQRGAAVAAGGGRPSLLQDVLEGLRYIWHWPGARALLLMATVINFIVNPGFALMPILITQHFGGGVLELGWIESAWGVGVVAGGLVLSVWGGFRRRILTTLTGLIGMGLGVLVVGLAPATAFGLALAAMFFSGFMNPITNGPIFAVLQARVAPQMQGRVFMVVGSIAGAMMPLGMVIAGPVSDWLNVRVWFAAGGMICALMGLCAFFIPAVVHLEDSA